MERKKIFIGGTGRSGTTILSNFLGTHRMISRIGESRFIIDKHGVMDLYKSLVEQYSIDQGRIAIRDFEALIQSMCDPFSSPFRHYSLFSKVGVKFVENELVALKKKLVCGSFQGWDLQSVNNSYSPINFARKIFRPLFKRELFRAPYTMRKRLKIALLSEKRPVENIFIPKYFGPTGKDLIVFLRNFVSAIMNEAASKEGKFYWCDDTPANMLNIDFLYQLFPEAYFVHIVRNPIGVAYSFRKQIWAPFDLDQVCCLLINLYEKILVAEDFVKNNIDVNFFRIKLEEVDSSINSLLAFLDISHDFNGTVSFKRKKANYWRDKIEKKDYDYIGKKLKPFISYFGYTL